MSEADKSSDWRSKYDVILRWGESRRRNLFTDVKFTVGEGKSAKTFPAHKNVLAFSSPVFEAMFYGALAEKKNDIPIVDIDPDAFEVLLRFVYAESISFSTVVLAAKVHMAADKYLISDLQAKADMYISTATFDDRQFWEVIHQQKFYQILRNKCIDYITKKATHLFKSDLFVTISWEVFQDVLQQNEIYISEFELFSAVVRWGLGNLSSKNQMDTKLDSLMRHIRFTNLTLDEFCNFLDCHPDLLDSDDSLAIMKHLHKPSKYKLPKWCATSSERRNRDAKNSTQHYSKLRNQPY